MSTRKSPPPSGSGALFDGEDSFFIPMSHLLAAADAAAPTPTHNDVDREHLIPRKLLGRKPYPTFVLRTKLRNHLIDMPTLPTLSRAERAKAAGKFVRRELKAKRRKRSRNWIRKQVIYPVLDSLPPPRA
jgi:hypothetical protein